MIAYLFHSMSIKHSNCELHRPNESQPGSILTQSECPGTKPLSLSHRIAHHPHHPAFNVSAMITTVGVVQSQGAIARAAVEIVTGWSKNKPSHTASVDSVGE